MKNPAALAQSIGIQRISLCLFAGALLTGVGCVAQHTYDTARAEADELTRDLDAARSDIAELDQRIAALQAVNRQEDAVTAELRAAVQREQEMLPILRQRADEKAAALQTQVAHHVSQNRMLAREMADAKQESASLRAMVTRYRQEMRESQSLPAPLASAVSTPTPPQLSLTPVVPPVARINPAASPQQTAQANPVAPAKQATAPRLAKIEPAPVDDSWTGMIKNWMSSLWSLIFN